MDRKQELRSFIAENYLFGTADVVLSDDVSFLESGLIDSTGLLELIAFIERRYGIRLDDQEIVPDNLDSVNRLNAFLSRKLDPPPASAQYPESVLEEAS